MSKVSLDGDAEPAERAVPSWVKLHCVSHFQVKSGNARLGGLPGLALATAFGAAILAGCTGGGHGSLDYDPSVRNAPGTITLGDAKVYSRETLINERAADIAWIDKLIANSEDPAKVSFKPILIREMEEISAFSAALGVHYDPAAALSYKRTSETGEIQQQIDVLKAQIQLEQLRRDIELIRTKLPDQTAPVNTDLSKLETAATPIAAAAVTPPDASQVAATVNALIASVATRLDAEAKPIGKTEAVSSPQDEFRDRLAYRDMLKAARNAAALDEQHDAGANRLLRLNLQATVLPDTENTKALGAIQIKVGQYSSATPGEFLKKWVRDLNASSDRKVDPRTRRSILKDSATLDALEESGDFARAVVGDFEVVMPILVTDRGKELNPQYLFGRANWSEDDEQDKTNSRKYLAELSVAGPALDSVLTSLCQSSSRLSLALDVADARLKSYDLVGMANLAAIDLKSPQPGVEIRAKYARAQNYQKIVLGYIKDRKGCEALAADYAFESTSWRVRDRPELNGSQQVRVYEVGPREQAQQVSTVARSANSLALAVSLAAAAPSSGVAGAAGAGYRRDLMNRASALDRVPEVVGYSVGGQWTFGWVIGPHATTDERGRAEVTQVAKTYDLSVDLSVPSWWSAMNLEVTTVWAPSPSKLIQGTLRATEGKTGGSQAPKMLPVQLTPVAGDYNTFTHFLMGDTRRVVAVEEVIGGPVTGCTTTTLFLKGPNLWRADKVLLLGSSLGHDAFVIAPDMAGIIVTVPAVSTIPGERAYRQDSQVRVLTPLGEGHQTFTYDGTLSGESCKAKAADATDPKAVTVSKVTQTSFVVPSLVTIELAGANLGSVDEVRLDGRKGAFTAAADGKTATAVFTRDLTEGIEAGAVKLEFFAKQKSVGPLQTIRIVRD